MRVAAVLEIARQPDGTIPVGLLAAAYRASHSDAVLLVLHAVTPSEVDRVLDPVVEREGCRVRGVFYVALHDDPVLLSAVRHAALVAAVTPAFRAQLAARGIACAEAHAIESALAALG